MIWILLFAQVENAENVCTVFISPCRRASFGNLAWQYHCAVVYFRQGLIITVSDTGMEA